MKKKIFFILLALIPFAICFLMFFEIIPEKFFGYVQGILACVFAMLWFSGIGGGD